MPLNESFINELKFEIISARKMLERVPIEKVDWKPHEKSMTLRRLASHVAEIPGWIAFTLRQDELNFNTGEFNPFEFKTTEELLNYFDKNVKEGMAALSETSDERMFTNWALKMDGNVLFEMPKIQVLRTWAFNHLVHHRAQLSVYLRMNDISVPGVYGPSADEQ